MPKIFENWSKNQMAKFVNNSYSKKMKNMNVE